MNEIERRMLKNQALIINAIATLPISKESLELLFIGVKKTEQLLSPKQTEESACDMEEEKQGVFIERAAPLTPEGIRAVCGTDEEYNKFVKRGEKNEIRI